MRQDQSRTTTAAKTDPRTGGHGSPGVRAVALGREAGNRSGRVKRNSARKGFGRRLQPTCR
jgi:hypothetical protein